MPTAEVYEWMILVSKMISATAIDICGSGSIRTYERVHPLGNYFIQSSTSRLLIVSLYHLRRAWLSITNTLHHARLSVVVTSCEAFEALVGIPRCKLFELAK